eukprot:7637635-Pyramimonas_sp.AAC.1
MGDQKVKPAELIRGNDIYATPNSVMDLRADEWSDIWSDPKADLNKVRAGFMHLRSRARSDPLEDITPEALEAVLSRSNAKKAKGVDSLGPIEWQRLPEPAKAELIGLLHAVEARCLWPQQIFM